MSGPLLNTKLYLPPARASLVARARLVERLSAGLQGPLTLVSAPAGYGKTTLISEWRASPAGQGFPLAWLSLDPEDNDLQRFLAYLIAAIAALQPGFGEVALISLQAPQSPPSQAILTAVINELSEIDRPFALALDDYHTIANQAAHDALAFLLDHLPAHAHLVILSRADPPLPLARLRARNQLVEIRAADLRFTSSETAAFLRQVMGLSLAMEDIEALEQRTEGWAAGLQLAGMALQALPGTQTQKSSPSQETIHSFVNAFAGSHHFILDYLAQEVLQRQSESVRSFLLQTSILRRLSGSLCDALTGRADGQAMLEGLEQSNAFTVPLDDERRWYRYHPLFVDVLHNHLQRAYPERVSDLHQRAAGWHERNHFVAEAIHHALAAQDQDRAAALVEQNAMSMLRSGELTTLMGWLKAIAPLVPERPWLCICQSWVLTLTGQTESVEPLLQAAERRIQAQAAGTEMQEMLGNIAAIRSYAAARDGDAQRTIDLGHRALESLPENDTATRSVVWLALGGAHLLAGDTVAASQSFSQAARLGQTGGNPHAAVAAMGILANLLMAQGQLHEAAEMYSQALRLSTAPDGTLLPMAARAYSGLARIFYEWNDLENAEQSARQCIELGQKWGNVDTLTAAHAMLARICQAQGDLNAAEESIGKAERLVRTHSLTPSGVEWVEMARVSLWLAQGNLETARRWVQQSGLTIEDNISYLREAGYLALGRVLLAQGDYTAALALLGPLRDLAEKTERTGSLIEILVQNALALQAMGDFAQALAALERALSLAEPEDYLRTFLDEGAPLARLLRQAGSRGIKPDYVSRLLAAFPAPPGSAPVAQQPLFEPLSERELEVLHLVAEGKSNQEIAAQLVLSLGTVKSHLSHIFGKLNVESRTQCLRRARQLKLLE